MNIKSNSFFARKTEVNTQFVNSVKKQVIFNKQALTTTVFGVNISQFSSYLLKEDGFFLLTESGFKIIIE